MFRFTIRDFLWLMVVIGLSLGWGIERWKASYAVSDAKQVRRTLVRGGWTPKSNDPFASAAAYTKNGAEVVVWPPSVNFGLLP